MKYTKLIYVTLFAVLLNVAFCDETVEVSVDNTPVEVETSQYENYLKQIGDLKASLELKEAEVVELQKKVETVQSIGMKQVNEIMERIHTYEGEVEQMKNTISTLEADKQGLEKKVDELKEEKLACTKSTVSFEGEKETMMKNVEMLKAENENLKEKNADLTKNIESLKVENENLNTKITKCKTDSLSLESTAASAAANTAKLESDLKEKTSKLAEQNLKVQEMKKQLSTKTERITDLKQKLKSRKQSMEKMEKETATLKEELQAAHKQLNLGTFLVDITETRILPFCEKAWEVTKTTIREVIAFVKEYSFRLKEWVKTNESCQMFKNKAISLYTDAMAFLAAKWNAIKPTLVEFYTPYAPTVEKYYTIVAEFVMKYYTIAAEFVMKYYTIAAEFVMKYYTIAAKYGKKYWKILKEHWEQFKIAFEVTIKTLFMQAAAALEGCYVYLKQNVAKEYVDAIMCGGLFVIFLSILVVMFEIVTYICGFVCHLCFGTVSCVFSKIFGKK